MDKKRIAEHLENYSEENLPYDNYFSLWMAFNVMYDHFSNEVKNASEINCVCHCTKKLPYDQWIDIFNSDELKNLLSIAPVFNEKANKKGDTKIFNELIQQVSIPIAGVEDQDNPKLDALMSLLYLIRCNQVHGAKTRKNPRDEEVLSVAAPILKTVVMRLASTFGIVKDLK